MAMRNGERFEIAHERLFPQGAYVVGLVEPVKDFDAKGRDDQKRDKVTGQRMWQCAVHDADAEARTHEIKVKFVADHQPVPPPEMPGLPFRPVEFEGLSVLPYVSSTTDDKGKTRSRLAWSIQATGMHAPAAGKANGKAATASAASGQGGS